MNVMRNSKNASYIFSAAAASFLLFATQAAAEDIIRTNYTITLTDPSTGAVYSSERRSIRSWPSIERCDAEKESFKARHTEALREYAFVNAGGEALEINITAGECAKQ